MRGDLHQLLRHPPNALGRRGSVLLLMGVTLICLGVSAVLAPPPLRAPGVVYLHDQVPQWLTACGWWLTGGVAVVSAFRRRPGQDAIGYAALVLMPLVRFASFGYDVALHLLGLEGNSFPSSVTGMLVWAAFCGLILTVSGWEEYPPHIPSSRERKGWRRR